MAKPTYDTKDLVFVAIDIAKRNHAVRILYPDGKEKALTVRNNRAGFDQLIQLISPHKYRVLAALEATGDYHHNFAYWLQDAGVEVYLVNTVTCARTREAEYGTRDKSDDKDAKVILDLLRRGKAKPYYEPLVKGYFALKEICYVYRQITQERSSLLTTIKNHYLTLYFPEVEYRSNSAGSRWWIRMLLAYPIPAAVVAMSEQQFIQRASKVIKGKVSKVAYLKTLYQHAQHSFALPLTLEHPAVQSFLVVLKRYEHLTEERAGVERMMRKELAGNDDYRILQTIPGVGPTIAAIILAECGDLRRFSCMDKFMAFCGFNLSTYQSGQYKGRYHLTKRGRAEMRRVCWLAAEIAIRRGENSFADKYHRYIKKHGNTLDAHHKAHTAVAAMIARVAYTLVTKQKEYDEFYKFS